MTLIVEKHFQLLAKIFENIRNNLFNTLRTYVTQNTLQQAYELHVYFVSQSFSFTKNLKKKWYQS